jgi:hypothetical protein
VTPLALQDQQNLQYNLNRLLKEMRNNVTNEFVADYSFFKTLFIVYNAVDY